jgi:hypothetical protein
MGVIVQPNLFAEISTVQALDAVRQVRTMQKRLFQDVETARQWLTEE